MRFLNPGGRIIQNNIITDFLLKRFEFNFVYTTICNVLTIGFYVNFMCYYIIILFSLAENLIHISNTAAVSECPTYVNQSDISLLICVEHALVLDTVPNTWEYLQYKFYEF